MIQPPSPPQKANEYLTELAEYYRELIEYHQKAAIAAAQQLGHVVALLGNDLESEVLPTKKVAELLSIHRKQIYELRDLYLSEFLSGVDYFQNNQGHYLWTKTGVEKLKTYRKNFDKKPSDVPMLPDYQGLSRIQAIKKLFASHKSKNWTITEVVNGLYGDIEKQQARYLRDPISQTLSAGHYKSYWKKVPKTVGVYRSAS